MVRDKYYKTKVTVYPYDTYRLYIDAEIDGMVYGYLRINNQPAINCTFKPAYEWDEITVEEYNEWAKL